jgi:hypothetical protein
VAASLTLLTPSAALVGLAALLPLAAAALARARVTVVRRTLGLEPPTRESGALALAAPVVTILLLVLAAAQPALSRTATARVRADAQALFVLDISRSMAASATPRSPTRLDRAIAAAIRLREVIRPVPSGVATMTDRLLPALLPVPDVPAFDGTVTRSLGIDLPPPRDSSVRATTFSALTAIEAGNYFAPSAKRRIVVLLTDGESAPFDAGGVARAFAASPPFGFVAIRIWQGGESIFGPGGRPELAYRPDPTGLAQLDTLARAVNGRAFDESGVGAAASYLRAVAGTGPTENVQISEPAQRTLAPYLAALALVQLAGILRPRARR